MVNICCLLDACTVINLIHIDEDDFLLKKIKKLDIHINDLVFNEIKANVYVRTSRDFSSKLSDKAKWKEAKTKIEQNLTFYRGKKNNNEDLLKDVGSNYFERIKVLTNYKKRVNGELCSTAYALYLSRYHSKNVFFYTDDYPAKEDFSDFFHYQQIGQIKDSVDLIILLYWLDENFTDQQLQSKLSELYSQYATEITLLKNKLRKFNQEKVDAQFLRSKKEIALKLRELIFRLDNLDFKNINDYYSFFVDKKAKCKDVYSIIQEFSSVFELDKDSNEGSLLSKITELRGNIGKVKVLKLEDLIDS